MKFVVTQLHMNVAEIEGSVYDNTIFHNCSMRTTANNAVSFLAVSSLIIALSNAVTLLIIATRREQFAL